MDDFEVTCPCGEVRLGLSGRPVAEFYCHCDDCQVVHGAAYVPVAMYREADVRVIAGTPSLWRRRQTPRASCARCGARLFAEPPGMGVRGVMAQLFPEGRFQPAFHMQCQYARLPVVDGLPHYAEFPPAFGGSERSVGR